MLYMIPQDCFNKVKDYFQGDVKKTWTWFQTRSNIWGGASALDMIKRGRGEQVKQFINNSVRDQKGFR